MPGVPSSRGCDACRKQKKKCDQAKPACARCARLQIPCVGAGQRRFKFKQENPGVPEAAYTQSGGGSPSSSDESVSPASVVTLQNVSRNELTLRVGGLIALLDVTDLRYDLGCYGGFLREIPKRMGTNLALDASAGAVTVAFSTIYTKRVSPAALEAYVNALKCLRVTLAKPETAKTPETLCAIYLIMLCQSWLGRTDDQHVSHGEVITHLLDCIANNGWKGRFENEMFFTLCLAVAPESIYNPRIKLGPWFRKIVETCAPVETTSLRAGGPGPALTILTLARLVEFVRDPNLDFSDIQVAFGGLLMETDQARQTLAKIGDPPTSLPLGVPSGIPGAGENQFNSKVHVRCQAQFGILLSICILVNSILCTVLLSDEAAESSARVATFVDELIELSGKTHIYRPLGASFMPVCLLMASVGVDNPVQLERIMQGLAGFESDMLQLRWTVWASELRTRFKALRSAMSLVRLERELAMNTVGALTMGLPPDGMWEDGQ